MVDSLYNPYVRGDTFILTPFETVPEAQKGNITILDSVGSWVHVGIWQYTGASWETRWIPACKVKNWINMYDKHKDDRGVYREGFPIPDIRSNKGW